MIAAFALTRMLTAWPFGKIIARWGERRTLSAGMALLAITSIAAGLSQNPTQLIIFRGLSGVGSAAFSVSAMSLLLRASEPEARGRTIGLFMGALNLGFVAGPALGGALLFMPPRWIFLLYGVAVALTGRAGHARHEPRSRRSPGKKGRRTASDDDRGCLAHRRFSCGRDPPNLGLGWIVYGLRASILPMLLLTTLHEGPEWIGIGLAICALLQVAVLPYAGKLTDAWGRRVPLIVGELLLAASLVLLWASPSLVSYLACMAVMGVGAALCTTAASAAIGDITGGGSGRYRRRGVSDGRGFRDGHRSADRGTPRRDVIHRCFAGVGGRGGFGCRAGGLYAARDGPEKINFCLDHRDALGALDGGAGRRGFRAHGLWAFDVRTRRNALGPRAVGAHGGRPHAAARGIDGDDGAYGVDARGNKAVRSRNPPGDDNAVIDVRARRQPPRR